MKKFFSVLLVLALCSIAGAAQAQIDMYLTYQGQSEITVTPSSYLELLLWYTTDSTGISLFDIEADVTSGPGTILGGTITATGRNPGFDLVFLPGGALGLDIEESGAVTPPPGLWLTPGILNPLGTISFHCDNPGLVTIGLFDVWTTDINWEQVVPIMHGMTITQIPEPATMLILAVGGLLLKRKK